MVGCDRGVFARAAAELHVEVARLPDGRKQDKRKKLYTHVDVRRIAEFLGRDLRPLPAHISRDTHAILTRNMDGASGEEVVTRADLEEWERRMAARFEELMHEFRASIAPSTATGVPSLSPRSHPAGSVTRSPNRTRPITADELTIVEELPLGTVTLNQFREDHGIAESTVNHAREAGKLTVERGELIYHPVVLSGATHKWWITPFGQARFMDIWPSRARHCPKCPHLYPREDSEDGDVPFEVMETSVDRR